MRSSIAAAATGIFLLIPGIASASSGSITTIVPASGGAWTATYTTVSDRCGTPYYCGWFPYASQVAVDEACNPLLTTNRLTYVGFVQDDLGAQGPSTAVFYPKAASFKL